MTLCGLADPSRVEIPKALATTTKLASQRCTTSRERLAMNKAWPLVRDWARDRAVWDVTRS